MKQETIQKIGEALGYLVILNKNMEDKRMKEITLGGYEKEELVNRFKALSKEELEFMINLIPVELCLKRLENELESYKKVKENISSISDILNDSQ